MGKRFDARQPDQIGFIARQPLLSVATVPPAGGLVNLSPKGMDSLRVTNPNRIRWLYATGSGNETAAHLAADPRMTPMCCGVGEPSVLHERTTANGADGLASYWTTRNAASIGGQPTRIEATL